MSIPRSGISQNGLVGPLRSGKLDAVGRVDLLVGAEEQGRSSEQTGALGAEAEGNLLGHFATPFGWDGREADLDELARGENARDILDYCLTGSALSDDAGGGQVVAQAAEKTFLLARQLSHGVCPWGACSARPPV